MDKNNLENVENAMCLGANLSIVDKEIHEIKRCVTLTNKIYFALILIIKLDTRPVDRK